MHTDLSKRLARDPLRPHRRLPGRPHPACHKYTYVAASPGATIGSGMTKEKARGGGQAIKWEAELASPNGDDFNLKWKWEAKSKPGAAGKAKTKWGTQEANKDDKKKPTVKCVQSKEIPAGCDIQIEFVL